MTTSHLNSQEKASAEPYPRLGRLYDLVTGDEDARVCKDISDEACRHLPRNFFAYLVANFLTKVADELASARLVLPWLLGTLGAPAAFVGFLVPVREAGVLLPQLAVAAYIRRLSKRKGVWLLGALLSALALGCMAVTATMLQGAAGGWTILAMLVLFSLARGLCSVSAKDVLGKTVSKTRRGALMGYSAAAAGVWLLAAAVFAAIREEPGATQGGGNAIVAALRSVALLKTDRLLRRYVICRALLLSAAPTAPRAGLPRPTAWLDADCSSDRKNRLKK